MSGWLVSHSFHVASGMRRPDCLHIKNAQDTRSVMPTPFTVADFAVFCAFPLCDAQQVGYYLNGFVAWCKGDGKFDFHIAFLSIGGVCLACDLRI
jgi:hypothetical protein